MTPPTNKKKKLEHFKEYMATTYYSYILISQTDTTLSYKREVTAKSANCATAGCLFLLGIIPGIIYYLVTSKPAQTLTLNVIFKDGVLKITGDEASNITHNFQTFSK